MVIEFWVFDLEVAIAGIDEELAGELKRLARYDEKDKWDPAEDPEDNGAPKSEMAFLLLSLAVAYKSGPPKSTLAALRSFAASC